MAEKEGTGFVAIALGALALVGVGVAVWFLTGTGSARVTGQVTFAGKPVAMALVTFVGEAEKNKNPIVALTNEQGVYTLVSNQGGGVRTGKYKVMVTKEALKDGTIPATKELQKARNSGLLVNVLPAAYEDNSTTPLLVEVRGGRNTINLELKQQP